MTKSRDTFPLSVGSVASWVQPGKLFVAPYVSIAFDFAFPVVCDLPLEAVKQLSLAEDWKPVRQKVPWVREAPLVYTVMFCARLVK